MSWRRINATPKRGMGCLPNCLDKEWAADGSSEHLRVSCHRQQSPTVCMLLILIKAHFCTPIAEYVEQSLTLIEPSCLLENAQVAT